MKKTVIIIVLTVIIVALIVALIFMGLKLKGKNENKKEYSKNELKEEEPFILDGPGMVVEPRTLSTDEWKERISDFYKENYGYTPEKITYEENEPNVAYIAIYRNAEVTDDYILDTQTGIASSSTQKTVNFYTGEFVENLSTKVNFENDECIAVGYIEKGKESQIKDKFFNDEEEYEYLTTVTEGDTCQFIVIPKKLDATLKVYKYDVSLEGELYFKELLAEAKGTPLFIKTQGTEVFPRVGIVYECDGITFTIPLMLSWEEGKLVFLDHEDLIKDISIY